MTVEELKALKEKVKQLQADKNEILDLQKEIRLLEKQEVIKRYLDLLDTLAKKEKGRNAGIEGFTDIEIVNIALRNIKITPTEGIYVYIGTYKYGNEYDVVHGSTDIPVSRTNQNADYVLYKNLESKYDDVQIPYKEAEEFENTHKIIIPQNVGSKERYFYELQLEYFKTVIFKSPEEAFQNIKKLVRKPNKDNK